MKLTGVHTALITPFDDEGDVDFEGLRENIRFQVNASVDGLVVLGTTGEAPTLSEAEKRDVIAAAVEEAKEKTLVIVGTGSYSTKQTILNTKQAADLGADAAMIITPYYNKPTQEGIYQHFYSIADAVDIPIILYNHPGRTGQNIDQETLFQLGEHPNIVGIKEASGSMLQASAILHQENDFALLSGDDPLTLPLIALGAVGVISVISNLVPTWMKKLVSAALSEEGEEARKLHHLLYPLFLASTLETNPIPIKAAMQRCGMPAGPCRLPLCEMQPINKEKLNTILDKLTKTLWPTAIKT